MVPIRCRDRGRRLAAWAGRHCRRVQARRLRESPDRPNRLGRHGAGPADRQASRVGLGNGYTVFEPFAMWGQVLPAKRFLQMHGGVELPSDSARGSKEVFLRTAFGDDRRTGPRLRSRVDAAGRAAVGAARRRRVRVGHRPAGAGHVVEAAARDGRGRRARFRSPNATERPTQALVYLLWDWYDGGFFDFWK